MNYSHVFCECGGIIGDETNKITGIFTCNRCGKKYDIFNLNYDEIKINQMTGWMYPVIFKNRDKNIF